MDALTLHNSFLVLTFSIQAPGCITQLPLPQRPGPGIGPAYRPIFRLHAGCDAASGFRPL